MIKKHIGLFRQMPLNTSDESIAKQLIRTKKDAADIQYFYRYYTRHIWDVRCEGYVMRGEENTHPPIYAQNDIRKYIAEHDMKGFEPNYFQVHGGYSSGYCGQGNRPGNRCVTYLTFGCGPKTKVHEPGHNFNLHHASTLSGSDLKEYGDTTSIMGSGTRVAGFNSVDMLNLDLPSDREIKRVTKTEQILICPIEMPKHGMHENEYQHIIIGSGREPYNLSLRKGKGVEYPCGERYEDKLYVHQDKKDEHSIRILGDIRPGGSKQIKSSIKVTYHEYKNETARVSIIFGDDPLPADIPMPEGFPKNIPSVVLEPKHSGAWFDPERNGQGFDIHIKEDRMVFYWYTFNYKQNSRRFYTATCSVGEGLEEFDIYTTEDGTWIDPTLHTTKKVGRGQLYFFDDTHGVFNFDTEEHGRGSVEIVPVALATDNLNNGSYYQKSRNGEGFTIQFFDDICVVYWYSYGPKMFGSAYGNYTGNMTQRWYVCSGTKDSEGTYNLTVYEPIDGRWMKLQEDSNVHKVGSVKLIVIDNNNIKFNYDIDADRLSGIGSFDLKKLF